MLSCNDFIGERSLEITNCALSCTAALNRVEVVETEETTYVVYSNKSSLLSRIKKTEIVKYGIGGKALLQVENV